MIKEKLSHIFNVIDSCVTVEQVKNVSNWIKELKCIDLLYKIHLLKMADGKLHSLIDDN